MGFLGRQVKKGPRDNKSSDYFSVKTVKVQLILEALNKNFVLRKEGINDDLPYQ